MGCHRVMKPSVLFNLFILVITLQLTSSRGHHTHPATDKDSGSHKINDGKTFYELSDNEVDSDARDLDSDSTENSNSDEFAYTRILYRNDQNVSMDEFKNLTNLRRIRRIAGYEDGFVDSDHGEGGSPYPEYGGDRYDDGSPLDDLENCTDCTSVREVKRTYRMTSIKQEILRKLRLSEPPNVAGVARPRIPHIDRLIRELGDETTRDWHRADEVADDFHATPMSVIMISQPAPEEVVADDSTVCWFPLRQEALRHEIINATLGIYIRNTSTSLSHEAFDTYLLVHRLGVKTSSGSPGPRRRIQYRRIRLGGADRGDEGHWIEIDLKREILRLLSRRETFYGIQIEAYDNTGQQVAVVIPRNDAEALYRPFLEIHVKETSSSRPKRTPERLCEEAGAERSCCRYPLTVDFKEFGWDFVIVPQRYSAYYCSGECPYLFMQRTAHSQLTQDARRDGGGPCCTPRKVSPISMIYYDDRMNIVYSKLPGMVVDSCGCS